jgi:hypothetical protein
MAQPHDASGEDSPTPKPGGVPGPEPSGPKPPAREQSPGEPATPVLTPEEQMALFERDLKEKDWGHQPC